MIRPFEERDRVRALALLGNDPRTIDSPSHHIQVADDGSGVALWIKPDAGDECVLGPIILSPENVGNRPLFYQLIAACIREAIDLGFTRGYAPVGDPALVALLTRDFDIEFIEAAWEPNTEKAVEWETHVDLPDVLAQLQRFL